MLSYRRQFPVDKTTPRSKDGSNSPCLESLPDLTSVFSPRASSTLVLRISQSTRKPLLLCETRSTGSFPWEASDSTQVSGKAYRDLGRSCDMKFSRRALFECAM